MRLTSEPAYCIKAVETHERLHNKQLEAETHHQATLRDLSLITQLERGRGTFLAMLKGVGDTTSFGVVKTRGLNFSSILNGGAESFHPFKRGGGGGGGRERFYRLDGGGGGTTSFGLRFSHIVAPATRK